MLTPATEQMPLHAHLNLLGWVSLGLIALIYRSYPRAAQTLLAKARFVLHNIGLPVLAVGLFLMFGGNQAVEPVVGVGSLMVLLGVLCLGVNLLRNVSD
ncbi:MAG: hypothetical protein NVSMB69_21590 [Novosphingobium sp.]